MWKIYNKETLPFAISKGQRGIVHTLPLLIIVAAVGVISFLLISSTLPLNGLFGILNQKPKSNAQAMMGSPFMNNDCGIPNQAFCDTFDTPSPVSRTGQLDSKKWMVARVSGINGAGQGNLNELYPTEAMHCRDRITGVLPDNDYFMCGIEAGESEHFMEVINAGFSYIFNDAMATQPFDFTNRTGTVIWDVDNGNSGGHGWWTEMWITDEPVPGPHTNTFFLNARNAFGIRFDSTCSSQPPVMSDAGASLGGAAGANIFRNYDGGNIRPYALDWGVTTRMTGPGQDDSCYKTVPDSLNHMKLLINKDRAELWATDNGDMSFNYKLKTVWTGLNLQFSKGFVHFEHATYNPEKAVFGGVTQFKTYHWDTIGFDGPVIQPPVHYQFPNSLTNASYGGKNIGYDAGWPQGFKDGPISVSNVNLTGAKSAFLTFNVFANTIPINYSINNGPWHIYTDPWNSGYSSALVPVDLAELKNGANTINFKATYWNGPIISNIDLYVSNSPAPTPYPSIVPTPTPLPTSTAAPTTPPTTGPFNGPHNLPGKLEAEDFDAGGEGIGYHDLETQNQGGAYRTEGVDIVATSDTGGGFLVGWVKAGEWLKYTVNVGATASYNLGFRVASPVVGGTFHLEVDGTNVTGSMTAPNTGDWQIFNTLTKAGVPLTAGTHSLKLVMDNNGTTSSVANFNYIDFTQTSGATPSPSSCPKGPLGDTNCDSVIDIQDYNNVFTDFGKTGIGLLGDVDKNQVVDIQDYNTVFTNFGK